MRCCFEAGMAGLRGAGHSLLAIPLLLLLPTSLSTRVAGAQQLCLDSSTPQAQASPLSFCSSPQYSQRGCCSATRDAELASSYGALKVSGFENADECAALVKQILCAECDPWADAIFSGSNASSSSASRSNPTFCDATSPLTDPDSLSFCASVYKWCYFAPLNQTPLQTSASGTTTNPLWEVFGDAATFCQEFGSVSAPAGATYCFNGGPYSPPTSVPTAVTSAGRENVACVERLAEGTYLNLVPHPDGSSRAFITQQSGVVLLVNLTNDGSHQRILELAQGASPFLDLRGRVTNLNELGLLGLALHPNFTSNGRFFVFYSCDSTKLPDCHLECACNSASKCDPAELGIQDSCRYGSIIAEYSALLPGLSPSEVTAANATEVRRIFTMGKPYLNHNAGELLFGPDGFLYVTLGDGGNGSDPFNFAQNTNALLGKILRLDVDSAIGTFGGRTATATNVTGPLPTGLWGEYAIPRDNPFVGVAGARPEIFALGLRNPWRCSFDAGGDHRLVCGDVGQELREEVDVIVKGGNYGWRVYEGTLPFSPTWSARPATNPAAISPIFPVLEYNRTFLESPEAAVTGGYISRSPLDPCLYGHYLYADYYGMTWAATPQPDGNWSPEPLPRSRVRLVCPPDSALPCTVLDGSAHLGNIPAFGQDGRLNLYLLSESGIYRLTRPGRCNLNSCPLPTTPLSSVTGYPVSSTQSSSVPTSPPASTSPGNAPATSDSQRLIMRAFHSWPCLAAGFGLWLIT